jgi:hypothetical protein
VVGSEWRDGELSLGVRLDEGNQLIHGGQGLLEITFDLFKATCELFKVSIERVEGSFQLLLDDLFERFRTKNLKGKKVRFF